MSFVHATSPMPDGRDIVIYPRGRDWGFRLPSQHTITTLETMAEVDLSTPSYGSTFRLERIEEVEGEVRVFLGFPGGVAHVIGTGDKVASPRQYGFPEIQHELERLKIEFLDLGGNWQEAQAWAQGASWDSHTARLRARMAIVSAAATGVASGFLGKPDPTVTTVAL